MRLEQPLLYGASGSIFKSSSLCDLTATPCRPQNSTHLRTRADNSSLLVVVAGCLIEYQLLFSLHLTLQGSFSTGCLMFCDMNTWHGLLSLIQHLSNFCRGAVIFYLPPGDFFTRKQKTQNAVYTILLE